MKIIGTILLLINFMYGVSNVGYLFSKEVKKQIKLSGVNVNKSTKVVAITNNILTILVCAYVLYA